MQAAVFSFSANHCQTRLNFLNFDIDSSRLDVFRVGYMKDSVLFNKLVDILKVVLIVPWPVKCGTGF